MGDGREMDGNWWKRFDILAEKVLDSFAYSCKQISSYDREASASALRGFEREMDGIRCKRYDF